MPAATTVKVTAWPEKAVCDCGGVVIEIGVGLTVTAAFALVAELTVPVTTTL